MFIKHLLWAWCCARFGTVGRDKSQILPLGALPGKRICRVHSENSTRKAMIHVLDSRLSGAREESLLAGLRSAGGCMQADGGSTPREGLCGRGAVFCVASVLEARPPLCFFSDQGRRCSGWIHETLWEWLHCLSSKTGISFQLRTTSRPWKDV